MSYLDIIRGIREIYQTKNDFIPLHEPKFNGNEKKYVLDAIDSTYVSSVGKYVDLFEQKIIEYTSAKYAIAVVNGTSALHISLKLVGVSNGDLVITQPLSFVATCNAISYLGASPAFIDVDINTIGMSSFSLLNFLEKVQLVDGIPYHVYSGKRIGACVPMHTFGIPCEIDKIVELCSMYNIPVVEDAAESIGSIFKNKHTGTFGNIGIYSFNGNKTITAGGGGIIVTNDQNIAKKAKHITTQAKLPHRWDYDHDEIGYNYRCPNLNSALVCAQLENIEEFIQNKRETHSSYKNLFENSNVRLIEEPVNCRSNYWLNAILFNDKIERDEFLNLSNNLGVMTRPTWKLLSKLKMYENCIQEELTNSSYIADRLVNIPSSIR